MKLQGTLNSNTFVSSTTMPVAFNANGDITVHGTLDANGNFVQATSYPQAFSANGDVTVGGTLDANGDFVAPTISAPVYQTNGNLIIQGVMRANTFVHSNKPVAFLVDGDRTIQGTLDANGDFIAATSKPPVFEEQ